MYGLLTTRAGKPVAVQVFPGQTHDHQTVPAQLEKLKTRFGLGQVVLVADRGMVTRANIDALTRANIDALATGGVDWITALKAPQVKKLAKAQVIQPSLFDHINLAEITSEEFPDERLVVCRNPLVAAERTRKREELLAATEARLTRPTPSSVAIPVQSLVDPTARGAPTPRVGAPAEPCVRWPGC